MLLDVLCVQLHVQSYSQLQQMAEAVECGLAHLSELGIRLLESMPPGLEAWCNAVDPADDESFARHPVLHQPPMSDPLDLAGMHVLSAMVRAQCMRDATAATTAAGGQRDVTAWPLTRCGCRMSAA